MLTSFLSPALFTPGRTRGILLLIVATAGFAALDSTTRYLSGSLHPFQMVFFRNLVGALWLLPFGLRSGIPVLKTKRGWLYGWRALINTGAMLCFFSAFTLTPIAEVTALGFTVPLFTVMLAVLIFKERLRLPQALALLCGILGTGVILQPGVEGISLGYGLALAGSAQLAVVLIMIKSLSKTDSTLTILIYMALLQTPLALLPALFVWQWPTAPQLLLLVLGGSMGTVGQICITQAYRDTEFVALAPFEFFGLIWASLLGALIFGEVPNVWTWVGGAVIFSGGLLTIGHGMVVPRRLADLNGALRAEDSPKQGSHLPDPPLPHDDLNS